MKEGCFGNVFDVPVEGQELIENDAKISDVSEVDTVEPSMLRVKLWVDLVTGFGTMMII